MTMPSNTKPARDQHSLRPVHVAIYEHPHGTDVRVFLDQDQAMDWRTGIAKEWWSNAYDDDPPPDDEIGEKYFERMLERGDEFFSTVMCDVEICPPDADAPIPSGDL
ncbi:hypothetical protein ACFFJ7_04215 [Pseudochelatococcus lubricantis]|jgi:hypothetical protein|uniref:hypothetical protein n=1 Tax=Pseudochelatococcus TaxID=1654719 RepID=UPI0035F0E5DD